MSYFNKAMKKHSGQDELGNESNGVAGDDSAHLVVTAAHEASVSEVLIGEATGNELTLDMEQLNAGLERIEAALAQIDQCAITPSAKPALSSESLAILDATLLKEYELPCTGNESGSSLDPVQATTEVYLGLEASASGAWKAMVEAYYKFIDWITGQFKTIFGNYEKAKSKAKSIKAREEKFDKTQAKDKIDVNQSTLTVGSADGNIDPANLGKNIVELAGLITTEVVALEDAAKGYLDTLGTALNDDAAKWKLEEAVAGPKKELATAEAAVKAAAEVVGPDSPKDVIGGRSIKAENTDELGKLKIDIASPNKASGSKPQAPLDRGQITSTCDGIIEACDDMIKSRSKMVDDAKAKSEFKRLIDGGEKVIDDSDYSESKTDIRGKIKIAQTMGPIHAGSVRIKLSGVIVQVMREALTFADKSLKAA